MADFTIDGRKLKAEKGSTILQIARDNGIKIPTLCSNDGLEPYGACRLCVVEVKRGSMVSLESSCTYIAEEGMEIKTDSPAVISARKFVLQLLLARCPNVKIIQDLAEEYGIKKPVPAPVANKVAVNGGAECGAPRQDTARDDRAGGLAAGRAPQRTGSEDVGQSAAPSHPS